MLEDEEVPLAVTPDEEDDGYAELADEEVPLAAVNVTADAAQEITKHGFWWWLPVAVAAAAGKVGYDKKHKKGIFVEKDNK